MGYVLRPGFMLPPLMFSEEEIEALLLGARWVADRGDERLGVAARSAVSKIAAVLPSGLRDMLDASALLVGLGKAILTGAADLSELRLAIRTERKVTIHYRDLKETETKRTVWPFALGYFDHVRVLVAWCELRQGFRHFRTDRISAFTVEEQRYPRHRQSLLVEPAATAAGGGGEIAFSVSSRDVVGNLFTDWTQRGLVIEQEPTDMDFGYTFVALDPDGHRLRVFAPTAP